MVLGETQYRTHLPWWLVLVHVGARGRGVGRPCALVTVLRRPPADLAAPERRLTEWRTSFESTQRPDARAARPGRRVPRLERRRPGRLARGRLPRADVGRRALRGHRSRRSSSTSRWPVRTCRSSTGTTRQIDWPETSFYHARPAGLDRDVVLLLGIEPNVRWRTFTELVVGLAEELGIELRRHARRLARRRAAHALGAGDRQRVERGARRASSASRRRATRGRRGSSASCTTSAAARDSVGEPLGGGAALRLARAEPARCARPLRAAGRPARDRDRRGRARGGRATTTRSRSARPSPPTRRRPPTSTSSSGAPSSSTTRPTALGRRDRRRADALPARARRRRRRRRRARSITQDEQASDRTGRPAAILAVHSRRLTPSARSEKKR